MTGRHHAQRCHDRPPVIADGGPNAAESQATLLVVDGVPLIPHTAQLGLERGAALDGAAGQTRQTLAGQATSKFVRRKCGEQDLARRRRVSGHSTDSHVDTKGMGAFDQINAHRAETVQHAQVHGLPGLRPETLHDGLGHLAQSEPLGGATSQGKEAVRKLVAVARRTFLDVSPENEGHQQTVDGALPQAELLGKLGQAHRLGVSQRFQDRNGAFDSGNNIGGRAAWRHGRKPELLADRHGNARRQR